MYRTIYWGNGGAYYFVHINSLVFVDKMEMQKSTPYHNLWPSALWQTHAHSTALNHRGAGGFIWPHLPCAIIRYREKWHGALWWRSWSRINCCCEGQPRLHSDWCARPYCSFARFLCCAAGTTMFCLPCVALISEFFTKYYGTPVSGDRTPL